MFTSFAQDVCDDSKMSLFAIPAQGAHEQVSIGYNKDFVGPSFHDTPKSQLSFIEKHHEQLKDSRRS